MPIPEPLDPVAQGLVTVAHFNDERTAINAIITELEATGAELAAFDTRLDSLEAAPPGGGGGGGAARDIRVKEQALADQAFNNQGGWKLGYILDQVTPAAGILFHVTGYVASSEGVMIAKITGTNAAPPALPSDGFHLGYGTGNRSFGATFWYPFVGQITPHLWLKLAGGYGGFHGIAGTLQGGNGTGYPPLRVTYEVI